MTVRMNGEEVAIEARAGKANETNATGTRRVDLSRNGAGEYAKLRDKKTRSNTDG